MHWGAHSPTDIIGHGHRQEATFEPNSNAHAREELTLKTQCHGTITDSHQVKVDNVLYRHNNNEGEEIANSTSDVYYMMLRSWYRLRALRCSHLLLFRGAPA